METDPVVDGTGCRTVRLDEIKYDRSSDDSRSLPCFQLGGAVYYIRVGGQSHLLIDVIPNVLVKERAGGKVDWRLPISVSFDHSTSYSLDTAYYFGYDVDTNLMFIQSGSGLMIVRERDGTFLANLSRSATFRGSFDVDMCPSDHGLYVGMLVPVGYDGHRREWHFLSNELLNAARQ